MVKIESGTAIFGGLGIAAIVAAAYFVIREVRGAGQDLSKSITTGVLSGVGESIESLGSDLSQFLEDEGVKQRQTQEDFFNFLAQQQQNFDTALQQQQENFSSGLDSLANLFQREQTILDEDQDDFTVDEDDRSEGVFTQDEVDQCQCGSSIIQNADRTFTSKCLECDTPDFTGTTVIQVPEEIPSLGGENIRLLPEEEDISGAEFARARNDEEFRRRQQERDQEESSRTFDVVNELPDDDQTFVGGGVSFIGGTIRENPVDTLGEVLDLFPELSASQAADFLNEYSGISPSDALRLDPDVSNIVVNVDGENVQVENVSISDLDRAENRASCTTCELYGLNCERCQIAGLR